MEVKINIEGNTFGAWDSIPGTANVKRLAEKIAALTLSKGFAFATNESMARMFDVSTGTVKNVLAALKKMGLVRIFHKVGGFNRAIVINAKNVWMRYVDKQAAEVYKNPWKAFGIAIEQLAEQEEAQEAQQAQQQAPKVAQRAADAKVREIWSSYTPSEQDVQAAISYIRAGRAKDFLHAVGRTKMMKLACVLSVRNAYATLPQQHATEFCDIAQDYMKVHGMGRAANAYLQQLKAEQAMPCQQEEPKQRYISDEQLVAMVSARLA